MLILNFIVILLMFIGLVCTLAPRLHGTVIIGVVAISYASITSINLFNSWLGFSVLILMLVAEIGANSLRIILTRQSDIARLDCIDTIVGNLAGVIVTNTIFGSLLGMIMWKTLIGKTLLARLDRITKVFAGLILTALLRLLCGMTLIIIVIEYIMHTN